MGLGGVGNDIDEAIAGAISPRHDREGHGGGRRHAAASDSRHVDVGKSGSQARNAQMLRWRTEHPGRLRRPMWAGWTAATAVLAASFAYEATNMTSNEFVKLLIAAAVGAAAVKALDWPFLGLFIVQAVAVFDRPIPLLGFELTLIVVTLGAFAPAMARSWRVWATPRTVAAGIAMWLAGATVACLFAADLGSAIGKLVTWALILNYLVGALGLIAEWPGLLRSLAVEIVVLGAVDSALGWLHGLGHYTIVGPPYTADRIDSSFG
jgi:hypothetical protein